MIYIGLTGWGDHDSIYPPKTGNQQKLQAYSSHFPIVEVDASFYAVQPQRNNEKWVKETPATFQFIIKAFQGMTGHQRGEIPFETKEEMFDAFKVSLTPYLHTNKLAMVLFQFPPWFDCKKENVAYLRWCKQQMGSIPCALEFRHRSWFSPQFYEQTLSFMKAEGWIHSVCDEPQIGEGSVPTVLKATDKNKTLVRLHGRNKQGWIKPDGGQNWREVRYLYRYNKQELEDWKKNLAILQQQCRDVYVLFNNNSGGDAADNGKEMLSMLGIEYTDLSPRQLDLFN
ncbi:DUF72 domain-containing protein [Bacillus atrophaeus]|uniref:DUF72 domain-containing protein n=1 Tax=Bacillus atrophaeus TaxID=1452 RepID=UPI000D03328F|nr:DUF72 domain-containing protein [Bacillus atrophaeus]MCY8835756.1 DUF72 domain-containing protein [Bacillus atrophaeus]MCY8921748.1 DUF72 domain-containing protein [Bacillus atrophaeus]MCY8960564.1 DUF72 domain-containing protein [Bacillus atrophaeus]MCY8962255.1 DUF72 domain-containing protein [Bacillus atrophaeus]MCY8972921.1 DUF72 domain-containing protein [Bacillus atrophaeus]